MGELVALDTDDQKLCGDFTQPEWDEAPTWQRSSAMSGVRAALSNPEQTPEDSHKGWLKEKMDDGWVYGEEKDPAEKTHPCMVDYEELPEEQQAKDHIFLGIVRTLAPLYGNAVDGESRKPGRTVPVRLVVSPAGKGGFQGHAYNLDEQDRGGTGVYNSIDQAMARVKSKFYGEMEKWVRRNGGRITESKTEVILEWDYAG